ncbi:hypothetical protein ACRALDRAFT_1072070 [Sodiomyces alcalophilus JCM 7366]|uniref:uncharacterized protein n=1 Tax=Sodiomyces alcalophilus JCM 7366 TaxID=591952 RepID=UPI0039B624C2
MVRIVRLIYFILKQDLFHRSRTSSIAADLFHDNRDLFHDNRAAGPLSQQQDLFHSSRTSSTIIETSSTIAEDLFHSSRTSSIADLFHDSRGPGLLKEGGEEIMLKKGEAVTVQNGLGSMISDKSSITGVLKTTKCI